MTFGPDGMLYIGLGDGGSAGDPHNNGQNLATPLGKILRINPRPSPDRRGVQRSGRQPVRRPQGRVPETWMWGLRNPWRFSFDRATGDVWIGDVGQDAYEEIDFARRGSRGSTGAGTREGFHEFKGAGRPARDPIVETTHADGYCAIVGGYVYRGRAIPALDGVYLYGDNCRPNIEGARATRRARDRTARPRASRSSAHDASARTAPASSTPRRAAAPSTSIRRHG